jgi:hypothetical protein
MSDDVRCEFEIAEGVAKCKFCNRVIKKWVGEVTNLIATCTGEEDKERRIIKPIELIVHIPRASEEYVQITAICNSCEHVTNSSNPYGSGLCGLLIRQGCGACRNQSEFIRFKRGGNPCPDKPPRFPGTETIREAATAKTQPTTKDQSG